MRLPVFTSLRGYRPGWLRSDAIAGLTVWAVLVPEALAYASIAGVSPVVGLYAAPGALILYAAFGSSKHLVVGPMAATAALSAAAVGDVAAGDAGAFAALTVALALTVGMLALAAGLLRLGFVANLISEPVLKGFIVGLALTIIVGQVPKLLGIDKGEGNFFGQAWHLVTHLDQSRGLSVAVGLVSLAIVLGLRARRPGRPRATRGRAGGDRRGARLRAGGPRPGDRRAHQRRAALVRRPRRGLERLPPAGGAGRGRHGGRLRRRPRRRQDVRDANGYQVGANRELVGIGTANLASGLSSGMVVNGSLSKTAVNGSAGARTQASGLVVALLTVTTLLFLTWLFEDLPEATLAAVVIAALVELVDVAALRALYRAYTSRLGQIYGVAARADFIAAMAAMLGVLIFDTLPGLIIGVVDSLLLLLYRVSRPRVTVLGRIPGGDGEWADVSHHPEDRTEAGVAVLRIEAGLFFANADHVRTAIEDAAAAEGIRAVVLDCGPVPSIDVTAARMLNQLAADLGRHGVPLVLAGEIGQVRDMVTAVADHGAAPAYHRTVQDAVDATRSDAPRPPVPPHEES